MASVLKVTGLKGGSELLRDIIILLGTVCLHGMECNLSAAGGASAGHSRLARRKGADTGYEC